MERTFSQEVYEFTVHSQRSHLIKRLIFFLVADLLCAALLFFCLFLASDLPFSQPNPFPAIVIVVQVFMAVLSLLVLFLVMLVLPFTIFTLRRLLSHQPTLLITHQGIAFQDLPVTGNTFLSWDEMASLSVISVPQSHARPINHLCLDPKDHAQFLSRFHPLQRVFVILGSIATGTLIHVPQWFLAEPVEEVLLQIRENFQEQLRTSEVQVPGTR